jgi:DNA-binding transcriptional LysR family regulator
LVVKRGSCTRAAEELMVTQPAVTIQVKSLEKSLNLKLIQHIGEHSVMTEGGELLYSYADKIFNLVAEAKEGMEDFKRLIKGTLKVAVTKTYARDIMPFLVHKFQEKFPDVKVILDEGNSEEIVRRILDLKSELGICARVSSDRKLGSIPFTTVEFVLVASPLHRFSKRKNISLKELNGERVILRERGSGSRAAVLKKFEKYGIKPSVLVEAGSLDFIIGYIEQGRGVSFIFEPDIKKELDEGILKIIPVEEGNVFFYTDIFFLNKTSLSPPAQAFLKMVGELKKELTLPNAITTR